MAYFTDAIRHTLEFEGGYVNDPEDPGGETNFGVSKRSYPDVDIENLTEDQALEIYETDFWDPYPYQDIREQSIATKAFDLSVNMGPGRAHKLLQYAVLAAGGFVEPDGVLGPKTVQSINNCAGPKVLAALKALAADYYRRLQKPRFLRGWLKRAYA